MHPGAHAATDPDRAAIVMAGAGTTLSYGELDAGANRLANLLRRRGLEPGDSMALWMENNATYLEAAWAPQRSGLYYTPMSSRLTAGEAAYILDDCGARALVASYHCREVAAEVVDRLPGLHTRLMVGGVVDGFEPYEEVVGAQRPDPLPEPLEGRSMLYSSGTTGRPKGVKKPLGRVPLGTKGFDSVLGLGTMLYGYGPDMVFLCPAPLYHAAPLWFTMAVHRVGGTAVVMEQFDPVELLALVERHRVTHTLVVPTMLVRLTKLPPGERSRHDLSSLRYCIHGAAPCPPAVKEAVIDWWGPIVHEYYAGTEANGFVACNSEEWLAHRGTVGRSLGGPTVHILGPDGEELPPGRVGTVYFAGGPDFEYHNDPDKTRTARDAQGRTTLGDVGYLDEDGYLYLTDRAAYTIISGGVNVYPQEAEDVLVTHPEVTDAAVFGIPDDDLGEQVKAVVQPADPARAGPDLESELIAWCRRHLAAYKCPRSVDFAADLPRHPTGKLYKRLLRDRYWEAAGKAPPGTAT
ncbi:MAG TPA: AMP-binding protein [Acidimicrobiales bacterium]|nr:AMP-binding protein [Acidimicrobiales bacterium]